MQTSVSFPGSPPIVLLAMATAASMSSLVSFELVAPSVRHSMGVMLNRCATAPDAVTRLCAPPYKPPPSPSPVRLGRSLSRSLAIEAAADKAVAAKEILGLGAAAKAAGAAAHARNAAARKAAAAAAASPQRTGRGSRDLPTRKKSPGVRPPSSMVESHAPCATLPTLVRPFTGVDPADVAQHLKCLGVRPPTSGALSTTSSDSAGTEDAEHLGRLHDHVEDLEAWKQQLMEQRRELQLLLQGTQRREHVQAQWIQEGRQRDARRSLLREATGVKSLSGLMNTFGKETPTRAEANALRLFGLTAE